VRALVRTAPAQVVGRFAYSWYLWHLPVLLLIPALIGRGLAWGNTLELCLLALWLGGLTHAVVGRSSRRRAARPIEDDEPAYLGAESALPVALRSWTEAPRVTAGVPPMAGPGARSSSAL
jgi:peptidoglycan/LPS O-acetylase OafA/YrhL